MVSIGSGVSIIKVLDYGKYERVSGTMIGGGTLMGLANLLTGINDFDEIVKLAAQGDHRNVDMLVKDIYGEDSPGGKLSGEILASSFAKVSYNLVEQRMGAEKKEYKKEDILDSLMFMISFNIG